MQQPFNRFVFLILALSISMLGSHLTSFALGLWALAQVDSVSEFSWITAAGTLPTALLGPVAGAWIDRWPIKRTLVCAQLIAMACTLTLAALYFTQHLSVYYIMVVVAISSAAMSVFVPAMGVVTTLMVNKDELPRASALIGLLYALVQVVYPSLGGSLNQTIGLQGIFIADLCCYSIAIFAMWRVSMPSRANATVEQGQTHILQEMKIGFSELYQRRGLFNLLLLFSGLTFIFGCINVMLLPMVKGFASDAQAGGMLTIGGLGLVLGSILVMSLGAPKKRIAGLLSFSALISIGIILMPISVNVWLVAVGAAVVMSLYPIANACSQTLWQTKLPVAVQGRVFGVRSFIQGIATPVAALVAGPLADHLFEPMLQPGGALAQTALAELYGLGKGRGIALMITMLGFVCLLLVFLACLNRAIRNIESDLPDCNDSSEPTTGGVQPEPQPGQA